MDGKLDSGTGIASAAAVARSGPLVTSGGAAASASTRLTDLVNTSGIPLFSTGDELVIEGSKGGISTGESVFVVGADGDTLGDLAAFLQDAFGIDASAATGTPSVRVENGTLVVESNLGQINAIELSQSSIVNRTGPISSPFEFTTAASAVGQGVTTTFAVYDSLGNQVDVRLRAVVESKSDAGITWRYYAESLGDSDASPLLGTGTITFDPNGQFVSATGTDIQIDRAGSGAGTPVAFTLDFSGLNGLAAPDGSSELIMDSQNGAPVGVLTNYSIGRDGIVTGVHSNQQEQVLGQIALATFINEEGLVALSENTFVPGPNSGGPTITAPLTLTAGAVISGALEQSNVEIAREFITLITAATGISAASRVVRAADEMLQELLLVTR
jgi:flagellar hook protein FlgE